MTPHGGDNILFLILKATATLRSLVKRAIAKPNSSSAKAVDKTIFQGESWGR